MTYTKTCLVSAGGGGGPIKRYQVETDPDQLWRFIVRDTKGEHSPVPWAQYASAKRCAARLNAMEYGAPPPRRGSRFDRLIEALEPLEAELREQASGAQDGYLLAIADRLRAAINSEGA